MIPAFAANEALFPIVGGDLLGVVHFGQSLRVHKPFPASGTLRTVARVAGIYDLKRMSQSHVVTETRDESGALLCETDWWILYRFDGDFGGPKPPKREEPKLPSRAPDWTVEEQTSKEQALLYRLSGDLNPLHADPHVGRKAGFAGTILHGLCTFGYVGRAVLREACGGDDSRFRGLSGRFTKPVIPGDTLRTEGWHEDGKVILRCVVAERPDETVFGAAFAEIA